LKKLNNYCCWLFWLLSFGDDDGGVGGQLLLACDA
jgi:hypothetical protein